MIFTVRVHQVRERMLVEAMHGVNGSGDGWFTEGFDTKDLLEAKALLQDGLKVEAMRMKCPSCNAKGRDEAKFCHECGAPFLKQTAIPTLNAPPEETNESLNMRRPEPL